MGIKSKIINMAIGDKILSIYFYSIVLFLLLFPIYPFLSGKTPEEEFVMKWSDRFQNYSAIEDLELLQSQFLDFMFIKKFRDGSWVTVIFSDRRKCYSEALLYDSSKKLYHVKICMTGYDELYEIVRHLPADSLRQFNNNISGFELILVDENYKYENCK